LDIHLVYKYWCGAPNPNPKMAKKCTARKVKAAK
jgi:hypothetical protein